MKTQIKNFKIQTAWQAREQADTPGNTVPESFAWELYEAAALQKPETLAMAG